MSEYGFYSFPENTNNEPITIRIRNGMPLYDENFKEIKGLILPEKFYIWCYEYIPATLQFKDKKYYALTDNTTSFLEFDKDNNEWNITFTATNSVFEHLKENNFGYSIF